MQTHRNPKTVGGSENQFNMALYEFSRTNYLQKTSILKERVGRKYIYILFLNTPLRQGGSAPYYVGQASSLPTHLQWHDEIMWHGEMWDRPATVHVIASVPDYLADSAEDETIDFLTDNKYILNNDYDSYSEEKGLMQMDKHELLSYVKDSRTRESLVPQFRELGKLWMQQESDVKAESTAKRKETVPHALHRVVLGRTYHNMKSRRLSLRLAKRFDPVTKATVYTFSSHEDAGKQSELLAAAVTTVKGFKGDWYLKDGERVALGVPLTFYPMESLLVFRNLPKI